MKVKLVLRPVPNEPSKSYLAIRTYENGKTKFKSLKRKISTKNLKKSGDAVTTLEPNHEEINELIQKELNLVRNSEGIEGISNRESKKINVIPFIDRVIENTPNQGTMKSRIATKKKFQDYLETLGLDDITFAQITTHTVSNFYTWLLKNDYKKNTANSYLQTLQLFVNYAKRDDKIKLPESYNPFINFKFRRKPVENKSLTKDELIKFANAVWDKERYRDYRDMFMFQLYGGGMRVSDVLLLQWNNIYVSGDDIVLDYYTFKTDKHMVTNLFPNALDYLSAFINKAYPDFINNVNESLERRREDSERMDMLKDNLEEEEKWREKPLEIYKQIAAGEFEDMYAIIEKEGYIEYLKSAIRTLEDNIRITNDYLLRLYRTKIAELHHNHGNKLIFPPLWNEKEGRAAINMDAELMNAKDYKKLTNERSKYDGVLKRMQRLLDIKTKISTHTSRHSFTQLLMESNVNTHNISMALGHNSMKTTELYRRTIQTKDSLNITNHLPAFKE